MSKLIIGVAVATVVATCATYLSSAAMAAEVVKEILPKVSMSLVTDTEYTDTEYTDTEYNVTDENTATEFGVVAGIKGLTLSLLPTYNWDATDISNIEFGAGYTFDVSNSLVVTPYGQLNTDSDLNRGDKIIGLKTNLKF